MLLDMVLFVARGGQVRRVGHWPDSVTRWCGPNHRIIDDETYEFLLACYTEEIAGGLLSGNHAACRIAREMGQQLKDARMKAFLMKRKQP